MAYLHCHTKACGWSQDDFWDRKYNPLTKLWTDIRFFGFPRIIKNEGHRTFSWTILILEIAREVRNFYKMKWWTFESWRKARATAVCPKCGLRNWDID